jgi:branched-chain amino acid transport system ATP-binding protein
VTKSGGAGLKATGRPLLVLNGVSAFYGRAPALEAINLEVGPGESVAVIGANGAGKTSLLRTVSGLLVRRSGKIIFGDVEVSSQPPHNIVSRGISHVPEGKHLFLPLTVAENLEMGALPLYARGRTAEAKAARDLVVELFPWLVERRQQVAGSLSGGEQQMLAIGRGLMAKPKLLLLDEPSTGLSPRVVEQVFAALRVLKQRGLAILLAEQNVRLALELADRAVVLQLGRVALSGTAVELRGNPEVQRAYLGGE